MKIPGMYKLIPGIFDRMIDKMFGADAGFKSDIVPEAEGFARDMVVRPLLKKSS